MKKFTSTETPILIIENWYDQINNIKTKFPWIADDDVSFEENKKDEVLNWIQQKLGKTKEEIVYLMSSFEPIFY